MKIKNQENFWSGLMFTGFGIATIVIARDYDMGTSTSMGPGYFPTYLGILMAILGVVITLTSSRIEGKAVSPFDWRGMMICSIGFFIFGWAIDRIGFVLALAALIFCGALAGKGFKLRVALVMTVVIVIGCVALFIYGLGLPFPIWWR